MAPLVEISFSTLPTEEEEGRFAKLFVEWEELEGVEEAVVRSEHSVALYGLFALTALLVVLLGVYTTAPQSSSICRGWPSTKPCHGLVNHSSSQLTSPRASLHSVPSTLWPLHYSSSYIRCDLMVPREPPQSAEDRAGACHEYLTSASLAAQREYWKEEGGVYRGRLQDSAYFSLHHLQHRVQMDVTPLPSASSEVSLGGRVIVVHENCAPLALTGGQPPVTPFDGMQNFFEQRFGPTWLEMRLAGPELFVTDMAYVPPSSYAEYHRVLLSSGSLRRMSMASVLHRETAQRRLDEDAILFADDPAAPVIESYPSVVQREHRAHGHDVCLYEATYSPILAGVYHLSVFLENVDFEHLSNEGSRQGWRRSQFAELWRSPHILILPPVIKPNSTSNEPGSDVPILQAITPGNATDHTFLQSFNTTHSLSVRSLSFSHPSASPSSTALWLLPLSPSFALPLLPRPALFGHWVQGEVAGERAVWWKREGLVRGYNAPTLGHCTFVDIRDYAFVPYAFHRNDSDEVRRSDAPLINASSVDVNGSSSTVPPSSTWSTSLQLPQPRLVHSAHPFSFEHAACCLAGRRFAMLGDSQMRALISRFASVFIGSEVKFTKQQFRQHGSDQSTQEWQCITLTVSTSTTEGDEARDLESLRLVTGLPNDGGGVFSALGERQFELCYFPSAYLPPSEVLPAFLDDTRHFDLIIVDSGHHPLSHGMDVPQFYTLLTETLQEIETQLTTAALHTINATSPPPSGTSSAQLLSSAIAEAATLLNGSNSLRGAELNVGPLRTALATLATSPSLGLQEMRRRLLWWSSQEFPRRNDAGAFIPAVAKEKRTHHLLQLTREVTRAITALLGMDYADVVESVSVPFQDCASDNAHVDWPVVDHVFVHLYDAIQQKLNCSCALS